VLHKFSLCLQSFQQLRHPEPPEGICVLKIPTLIDIVEVGDEE
jgi:hypothetical protein